MATHHYDLLQFILSAERIRALDLCLDTDDSHHGDCCYYENSFHCLKNNDIYESIS